MSKDIKMTDIDRAMPSNGPGPVGTTTYEVGFEFRWPVRVVPNNSRMVTVSVPIGDNGLFQIHWNKEMLNMMGIRPGERDMAHEAGVIAAIKELAIVKQ